MSDKVILGPDGKPKSVVDDKGEKRPAPKVPEPQHARLYFEIARAVLYAEHHVFHKTEGNLRERLKAAQTSYIETGHRLKPEQVLQKRIWLAPHLFAEVEHAVPPPGVSKIRIACAEVREEFKVMVADGYLGLPIMGLAPSEILKQMSRDKQEKGGDPGGG